MPPDVKATVRYREIQMRTPSGICMLWILKQIEIVATIQPNDYWDDKGSGKSKQC